MRHYGILLVIFSVAALVLAAPVKKGDVKLARIQNLKPPDPIDPNITPVRIFVKFYWDPEVMQKNNEIDLESEEIPTPGHCC